MTTYTVVAYRPDSVDTCRGCVLDRSDSAFELKVCHSVEEAAQFFANKCWENETREREFAPWDLTVLVDGLDSEGWWSKNAESALPEPDFDEVEHLSIRFLETRRAAEAQRKKQIAEQAALQAARDRQTRQQKREAVEQAEFERLSAKFGALPSSSSNNAEPAALKS